MAQSLTGTIVSKGLSGRVSTASVSGAIAPATRPGVIRDLSASGTATQSLTQLIAQDGTLLTFQDGNEILIAYPKDTGIGGVLR